MSLEHLIDDEKEIKKISLNRSKVITSQYILKVMKCFIDLVKLELKGNVGMQIQRFHC